MFHKMIKPQGLTWPFRLFCHGILTHLAPTALNCQLVTGLNPLRSIICKIRAKFSELLYFNNLEALDIVTIFIFVKFTDTGKVY